MRIISIELFCIHNYLLSLCHLNFDQITIGTYDIISYYQIALFLQSTQSSLLVPDSFCYLNLAASKCCFMCQSRTWPAFAMSESSSWPAYAIAQSRSWSAFIMSQSHIWPAFAMFQYRIWPALLCPNLAAGQLPSRSH